MANELEHLKAVREAQIGVVQNLVESGRPLIQQLQNLSQEAETNQNKLKVQSSRIQKDLSVIVNDLKTRRKEIEKLDEAIVDQACTSNEIDREIKTSAEFKITIVTEMGKFEDALERAEEASEGKRLLHAGDIENLKRINKMEVAKCAFGILMTFVTIFGNIAIIGHYKNAYEYSQENAGGLDDTKVIFQIGFMKTLFKGADFFGDKNKIDWLVYYSLAIVWLFARGIVQAITFVVLVRRNKKIASVVIDEEGNKNKRYWCMIVSCLLLMGPVLLNGCIIYLLCKQKEDEEIDEWRKLLINFKLGEIIAGTVPQLAMNIANMAEVSNTILSPISTVFKNMDKQNILGDGMGDRTKRMLSLDKLLGASGQLKGMNGKGGSMPSMGNLFGALGPNMRGANRKGSSVPPLDKISGASSPNMNGMNQKGSSIQPLDKISGASGPNMNGMNQKDSSISTLNILTEQMKGETKRMEKRQKESLMSTVDKLVGTANQKFQLAQGTITSALGLTTWAFHITKRKFKRDGHHPASAFLALFILIGSAISTSITSVIFNPARYIERSIPIVLNFMNLILIVAFIAAPWKRWIWRVVATLVHSAGVAGSLISMHLLQPYMPSSPFKFLNSENMVEEKLGDIMFLNIICLCVQGLFGLLLLPTSLICVKMCNPMFNCISKMVPEKDEESQTEKKEESEASIIGKLCSRITMNHCFVAILVMVFLILVLQIKNEVE